MDSVRAWAIKQLDGHLNKGLSAESFVENLLAIGSQDPLLITEAVHQASQTINSKHFADEFVKRYKPAAQATQQDTPPVPSLPPVTNGAASTGVWNEVVKKSPASNAPADNSGNFKVVSKRKKR
jgi:PERQ amino acid-rich with GYF domain-containing protein